MAPRKGPLRSNPEGNVVQVLYTNQRVGPALGSALGKCNAFVEGISGVLEHCQDKWKPVIRFGNATTKEALLLLDQIKRDKGVWRMPWQ